MAGNENYKFLKMEEALELKSDSERYFAVACLRVDCYVYYQIAIENSVIDFLVINPRLPKGHRTGKLVEVTMMDRSELFLVDNRTSQRKQHQIENMKGSGLASTILYRKEMEKLHQKLNTSPSFPPLV